METLIECSNLLRYVMGETDTNDCPPGSKPLEESAPWLASCLAHLGSADWQEDVVATLRLSVKLRRAASGRPTLGRGTPLRWTPKDTIHVGIQWPEGCQRSEAVSTAVTLEPSVARMPIQGPGPGCVLEHARHRLLACNRNCSLCVCVCVCLEVHAVLMHGDCLASSKVLHIRLGSRFAVKQRQLEADDSFCL